MLYYVMPYVEGESLRERLDREQQLSVEESVRHGCAIASALDYANRHGVIHRDIKPENVMLYEGVAMVMDFGIAKAVSAADSATLTQIGMMIGTPAYVSPEQAAGETNLDGRSDQYSLACVIYEMLSGERPFNGSNAQAIMAKRFTETAKPLRTVRAAVPESIERAVAKAMSTDPSGRFTTTAQFAQALVLGQHQHAQRHHGASAGAGVRGEVGRGASVRQHERGPGQRVFHRRHGRGDHQRAVEDPGLAGCVAHLVVRLQGQERGHRRDRQEAQGLDGARRQRAARWATSCGSPRSW